MKKIKLVLSVLALAIAFTALSAVIKSNVSDASHYRYGYISWTPDPADPQLIHFTVDTAWRTTFTSDALGGTFLFSQPSGLFSFGDGTSSNFTSTITSKDTTNGWVFGTGQVSHRYSGPGPFTAFFTSCCRIGTSGNNQHINNPNTGFRAETMVFINNGSSPITSIFPIVQCPINGLCQFTVPAADPDGDTVSFSFASGPQLGFTSFDQPGPPDAPNAATINSATGLYSWDTTGATLASGGRNTLYSTGVLLTDSNGNKSTLEFLIQLVPQVSAPPVFDSPPSPACGSTVNPVVGSLISFKIQGSDPDPTDTVTLNAVGLPPGATMTPALPTTGAAGNAVMSTFSWTPTAADVGLNVATFSVTDQTGQTALCSININVTLVPTLVDLSSFTANGDNGSVVLEWETAAEIDNAGFNILRSEGATGNYTRVNEEMISSQGSETSGAKYSFTDTNVKSGKTYHYNLEDVEYNGQTALHGPIAVEVE